MSDNDAEELLPVAAFEKVIKTTITQATSPVTREDMGTAYKAAIPGATVTVSPEAPCRGRAGAPGLSPRRHASPCAWQCWRSSPIRSSAPGAEHHARWQAGLKSEPAAATLRPHHRKTTEAGPEALPTSSCRIRACDSSKCRSRWWRSDQPIWTVSVGIRHEPVPAHKADKGYSVNRTSRKILVRLAAMTTASSGLCSSGPLK